jgi:hypothetical protein
MSLLALRCAPSPLLVPEKILDVGSLRTLSCPDTSPGFIPGLSNTSDFISFHFREPLSDTNCSRCAALSRGGPLRRSRPLVASDTLFVRRSCHVVWVNPGVALLDCPVSHGRAQLRASGGPDTAADMRSTKALCSASTVCQDSGVLAHP